MKQLPAPCSVERPKMKLLGAIIIGIAVAGLMELVGYYLVGTPLRLISAAAGLVGFSIAASLL